MRGLLIANKDRQAREELADLFSEKDYRVITADSVGGALDAIVNDEIQVVVLDGKYNEQNVVKLIPLLKKCNRNLSIILVSDDMPMTLVRRIRQEGIFYHVLREASATDNYEEISQAVHFAFKNYDERTATRRLFAGKQNLSPVKSLLTSLLVTIVLVSPTFAVDTAVAYNSGLLVLLFVGFCALLIVAQLVPALMMLFGLTKSAAEKQAEHNRKTVTVKSK